MWVAGLAKIMKKTEKTFDLNPTHGIECRLVLYFKIALTIGCDMNVITTLSSSIEPENPHIMCSLLPCNFSINSSFRRSFRRRR